MKFVQMILTIVFVSALLGVAPAFAQQERIHTPRSGNQPASLESVVQEFEGVDPGLEVGGLVVDQTLTKAGRDFYEIFYNGWQQQIFNTNFIIHIKETPWPGRVQLTRISVIIEENEVVGLPLQPRYEIVEQTAKYAIGQAYNFLANYEQIQLDLQSEDMQGTGIY